MHVCEYAVLPAHGKVRKKTAFLGTFSAVQMDSAESLALWDPVLCPVRLWGVPYLESCLETVGFTENFYSDIL